MLPLIVYYDDYENNNPLGSHRGLAKTGAVYASIPCLPPNLQSKLENISVVLLFNSLDEKDFSFGTILNPLLQELKELQTTGITIFEDTPSQQTIHFALLSVVGDNLAVNAIHGFICSFSGDYCCRFCLIDRSQIKDSYEVKDSLLRTQTQYDLQVEAKDFDSAGIKSRSCFNDLPGYNVIDSMCVDMMHDVLEGVCQYDLGKILNVYIYKKKYFTLEVLNNRVRGFDYGPIEKRNKPPDITQNHMKNECIIISLAEMLCLIRNIHLILGDLIPEHDEYWSLIILLKKIVDITTAKALLKNTSLYFKKLVSEYLKKLLILFPNFLKFKHHVLIHYSYLFLKFGPIGNMECSIFERLHKHGKVTSHGAICRINVSHTIAVKNQLRFNNLLRNSKKQIDSFTTGPVSKILNLEAIPNFYLFAQHLPAGINNVLSTSFIKYMGKELMASTILMMPSENGLLFYYIHNILLEPNRKLILITTCIDEYFFDEHYQSNDISIDNKRWYCLFYADLKFCSLTRPVIAGNGKTYIPKRWI